MAVATSVFNTRNIRRLNDSELLFYRRKLQKLPERQFRAALRNLTALEQLAALKPRQTAFVLD